MGSGTGHHAAHLARVHGARVTAVELSPTQHERATSAHAGRKTRPWRPGLPVDPPAHFTPYATTTAPGSGVSLPRRGPGPAGPRRRAGRRARRSRP
ncbi:class I SAM-dependent methyltransferase [Streptomyces griseoviridis]|uniref:class I SAM-dependent methyltransferase n=1 Tax=Streptomyces griseoviridis TaxID=45398 RepID=UPI00351C8963